MREFSVEDTQYSKIKGLNRQPGKITYIKSAELEDYKKGHTE